MTKKIFIFILFTGLLASCSKDFLDINSDPNNSKTSNPKMTLPAGMGSSAYVIGGWYQLLGGFWAQHWAQSTGASQWTEWEDYSIQPDQYDRQYNELYAGALNDYEFVRKEAAKANDWTYYLVATCMQSYTYQVLADLYSKIPFTEALKGDANLRPKWDDGSLVYDSLIRRLDYALSKDFTVKSSTNPTATSTKIGTEDLVFQGNINKWIQFANTLKLKIYMHQVYAREAVSNAGIKALLATNNFLTSDAKVTAFGTDVNKMNPIYETGVDRLSGNLAASYTLLNFLKTNADPRLNAIYNPPSGKAQIGLHQGHYKTDAATYANIQYLSTPNLTALDPVFFFSAAESYFLQSEAQLRYGTDALAKENYEKGIQASMARFGVNDDPTLYAASGVYEYPSTTFEDKLKAIMVQKWIASANSESLEAFFDQNRTGYPNFYEITPTNVTSGKFPKRLPYPDAERKTNPNTPTYVPLTDKVWWDKK